MSLRGADCARLLIRATKRRKGFNLAIRWGWRGDNPAFGVHRNHEEKRVRYLTPAEILILSDALSTHSERISANAIRLLLLTGARRGEVLAHFGPAVRAGADAVLAASVFHFGQLRIGEVKEALRAERVEVR